MTAALWKRALRPRVGAKFLAQPALRHFVLAEALRQAGIGVSAVTVRGWSRADQGQAYLWAKGLVEHPPACVLTDVRLDTVARALEAAGVAPCAAVLAQWSPATRRLALGWARAFAGGAEDLPMPECVARLEGRGWPSSDGA